MQAIPTGQEEIMSKVLDLQKFNAQLQIEDGKSTSSIFCGAAEEGLSTCSIDCGG